jgi:hypothetical protein
VKRNKIIFTIVCLLGVGFAVYCLGYVVGVGKNEIALRGCETTFAEVDEEFRRSEYTLDRCDTAFNKCKESHEVWRMRAVKCAEVLQSILNGANYKGEE